MSLLSFTFLKWTTVAVAALLSFCTPYVEASSAPPRPLKRLAQPSIHMLEIMPRGRTLQQRSSVTLPIPPDLPVLQYSDSFRLTIGAFEEIFHLHLRPNPHILHSSARINYYTNGPHGEAILDRTEPLLRGNVKAYWGEVIHPEISHSRMREDTVGGLLNSENQPMGWARIMVHHQGDVDAGVPPVFEGAFSVNGDIHHIMTKDNYFRTKHPLDPDILSHPDDPSSTLVVFRDSDIMNHNEEAQLRASGTPSNEALHTTPMSDPGALSCSHDHLQWNSDPSLNPVLMPPKSPTWFDKLGISDWDYIVGVNTSDLVRRDDVAGSTSSTNFAGHIGQTAGCPLEQTIVYTGVAADCKYVQQYGSSQNATLAILNDWNTASGLYKSTFNVSLGILQLDMHDATCPSPADPTRPWNVDCNTTLNDRLSLFSKWRGDKGDDGTGLWHLMSGCPTNTEVGVAWLGTLCQTTSSGSPGNFVSSTAVSTACRSEWQVVAHETGHNFGAIHDCTSGCNSTSSCCPLSTSQCDSGSQFIMSPTTSTSEGNFSACSIGNICSLMQSKTTNLTCVRPPDATKQTLSLRMCGNGVVEPGEDCDPGQNTTSTCCDPASCKFTSGSVCDPTNSQCCTAQCQFSPSTQVCRPAQDPICDIPESCTGTSAACPWDKTQPNGKSCGPNGLACASGQCTSETKQCQTIGAAMGLTTACPTKGDTSCRVSCQDPTNSKQCMVLQAELVDGSPCGFGGQCSNGKCQTGGLLNTMKTWYLTHLQISIPVTVVAGIFVLLLMYGLYRCLKQCFRDRRSFKSSEPALKDLPPQRLNSWVGSPPMMAVPTAPEPGVWIPPARRSSDDISMRREARDVVPPSVLRPASAASQRSQPFYASTMSGRDNVPFVLRPGSAASQRSQPQQQQQQPYYAANTMSGGWDNVPSVLRPGPAATQRSQPFYATSVPGRGGVPPVLRPGTADSLRSQASYSTNPRAAYGARDLRSPPRISTPSGDNARSNWVDPAAWNGTR